MNMLWDKDVEKRFFNESIPFASPEQLFYLTNNGKYVAYWPKNYRGEKSTLQSRNTLIGKYTEKWTADLIRKIVEDKGLFVVNDAICDEIGLSTKSPADVIISRSNGLHQEPENILAILEVKMSIVWNWELKNNNGIELKNIGDYKTHQGNPGLLRSDSMLKAIGKSINIRVSSPKASQIPIIIIGNTPITNNYYSKVDHLKAAGIVQGFWSVNPNPLDNNGENIKNTEKQGFNRFDNFEDLRSSLENLLSEERNFFSSMKTKEELGRIIEIANMEQSYEKKGEVFLKHLIE